MDLSEAEARSTITRLSELTDVRGLRTHIVEGTKHGTRPHKTDPWHYTREYVQTHASAGPSSASQVIQILENAGASNEIGAARLLLWLDDLIP